MIPIVENVVNMVVEIPKGTSAKYEVAKGEKYNPIKQDVKDGQLRVLKHSPMPFNYGMLPQTWADPAQRPLDVPFPGDNDPLDVIDISSLPAKLGDIMPVKVLGALCLIDQGEADWKVVAINVNDPLAERLNGVDARDVELLLPEALTTAREWFKVYKVAEGKGENSFAYNGECLKKEYALELLMNSTFNWIKLHSFQLPDLGFAYTEHNLDLHFP